MRVLWMFGCWVSAGLLYASPAAETHPPAAGESLATLVAREAAEQAFSGTVLVRQHGKTRYSGSFGQAERTFEVPNTRDTQYKIASITKLFTAALILQLVEEGKLDLDAPLLRALPAYTGSGGPHISLHQLLNHTSGLPNFDTVQDLQTALTRGIPVYQSPQTSDTLLREHCSQDPVHPAGSHFDYNNADYIVLGKVIEAADGTSFETALHQRILDPLGLQHTGMLQQQVIVPRLAATYFLRPDLQAIVPDLPVYPENWYAAGAMYSTVDDLAVFADALFDGRLLKQDSLSKFLKPGLDDYGYGAWSYTAEIQDQRYQILKRPGQIMGAQTQLYRVVEAELTVIILSNVGNTDLDAWVAKIARHALADKATEP